MHLRRVAAALALLALISACGGVSSPSDNTTEPFSGTLAPGGINSHQFTAGENGEFEMRLTSIQPTSVLYLGVGLGIVSGGQCSLTAYVRTFSPVNQTAVSGPLNKLPYCAVVFDPGNLSQTVTYSLNVSYPR